jgi:flagellar hook-associated protein FlgK
VEDIKKQWHPAFCGAAELEFRANKRDLEFQREYNLSKEPLRVDLLIIKKLKNVQLENEIGHIFRTYNVIEYKSPEDGLTIDDFGKVLGYTSLYKSLGKTVNEIPFEELTATMIRDTYPRELMAALEAMGMSIQQKFPGIYYVTGALLFPVQIVVGSQLSPEQHSSLRILSNNAKEADVAAFLTGTQQFKEPGDKHNADAVLQVSVVANPVLYSVMRRDDQAMCEALRELMKDEIEQEKAEAKKTGAFESLLNAIKNLMATTGVDADQAMNNLCIPAADRAAYKANL